MCTLFYYLEVTTRVKEHETSYLFYFLLTPLQVNLQALS